MTDNDTTVERAKQELAELGQSISAAVRELRERREQRNLLTSDAQQQKQRRKDLSKVIKEKIAEVKTLREQRGDRPARAEGVSPGRLRMEIQRLEHKLETSAMDFSEEQKLTKILKEKKAQLAKIGGASELDHHIRTLSKEIDKLKRESDVAHEQVTTSAQASQTHHETILSLSKQVEAWKAREAELQAILAANKPARTELPAKKPKKQPNSASDEKVINEKVAEVEQKVKEGKKLTTEDLLAFQARK